MIVRQSDAPSVDPRLAELRDWKRSGFRLTADESRELAALERANEDAQRGRSGDLVTA